MQGKPVFSNTHWGRHNKIVVGSSWTPHDIHGTLPQNVQDARSPFSLMLANVGANAMGFVISDQEPDVSHVGHPLEVDQPNPVIVPDISPASKLWLISPSGTTLEYTPGWPEG